MEKLGNSVFGLMRAAPHSLLYAMVTGKYTIILSVVNEMAEYMLWSFAQQFGWIKVFV